VSEPTGQPPTEPGPEPTTTPEPGDVPHDAGVRTPRPLIERLGLAAIATVLAILFGGVAAAAWIGGEVFLAAMAGIGCLMTAWVGGLTLFRG
jgi:hypothetical protein